MSDKLLPWSSITGPAHEKLRTDADRQMKRDPEAADMWASYVHILKEKGAPELLALQSHVRKRKREWLDRIIEIREMKETQEDDDPATWAALQPLLIEACHLASTFSQKYMIIDCIMDEYCIEGKVPMLKTASEIIAFLPHHRIRQPGEWNMSVSEQAVVLRKLTEEDFGYDMKGKFVWKGRSRKTPPNKEMWYFCECLNSECLAVLPFPADRVKFVTSYFLWEGEDGVQEDWNEVSLANTTSPDPKAQRVRDRYSRLRKTIAEAASKIIKKD